MSNSDNCKSDVMTANNKDEDKNTPVIHNLYKFVIWSASDSLKIFQTGTVIQLKHIMNVLCNTLH